MTHERTLALLLSGCLFAILCIILGSPIVERLLASSHHLRQAKSDQTEGVQQAGLTRKPQRSLDEPISSIVDYRITKAQFNTPISPLELYVDVSIYRSAEGSYWVRLVIQRKTPVDIENESHRDNQIVPYLYKWVLVNGEGVPTHQWLAHFIQNRDGTYHTVVRLPLMDLKRSHVLLYFEGINSDGVRDDVMFDVDLSGIEWAKIDGVYWWRDGKPIKE